MVDTVSLPLTDEQIRTEVRRPLTSMLRRLEYLGGRADLPPDLAGAVELARQAIAELWRVADGDAELIDFVGLQEWRRRHG